MKAVIDDTMIRKAGGREPCDISYKAVGTMTFNMGSGGATMTGSGISITISFAKNGNKSVKAPIVAYSIFGLMGTIGPSATILRTVTGLSTSRKASTRSIDWGNPCFHGAPRVKPGIDSGLDQVG
jgi:hypothetical protein